MTPLFCLLISLASLLTWGDEPPQVTLVFAGDAMQHQAQIDAARRVGGKYDYSDCFREITPYITRADYAVVNLETPLGGAPFSGYPCFCAPDEYLDALKRAGFDMMLTANNHTLDRRDRGLKRTIDRLDLAGVDHLGTYRNKAERDSLLPLIRDVEGFRIAFLNYTYGTNGIKTQTDAVVDYIDRVLMLSDIEKARKAGAEIVTVCIHWGDEYSLLPNSSQRSLADFLVDSGADLVIGSHPHVIQPMEMRTDSLGRRATVVYSLGNFISNMRTRDTRGGAMVRVRLSRDMFGRAVIDTADYRLFFTLPPLPSVANFRVIPVEAVCDESRNDIPSQWGVRCKEFIRSAESIFGKHNKCVPRDTSSLISLELKNVDTFEHTTQKCQ
ncbi:CapA family protein [uncultured Muribaculum sp.]|uniref:CapA family protein n=1 Tax=uncultured Muribaculum sp. TaxID=1918613 RepID=UPI0025CCFE81|nr:CapA family protein [uncultured Muribaculum sp.]